MEIKSLQILAGGMRHTMQKSPDGEEVGVACRFVPCCLAGVCVHEVVLAFYSPGGKEPLRGRRAVGR